MGRSTGKIYLSLAPSVAAIMILFCGPLLAIVAASFTRRAPNGGLDWSEFSVEGYVRLFAEPDLFGVLVPNYTFLSAFTRSLSLSLITTAICLLIAVPVAIYMSQSSHRIRNLLLLLITIPFWANLLARNYAWILILRSDGILDGIIRSVVPEAPQTGLLYTQYAVLIGLIYSFLPFMVLPIYASAERFDWRLADAALDLGASRRRVFVTVILPLLLPGIIAGSILVFIPSMGSYITPRLLGGGRDFLLGNLIAQQFGSARNWAFGASIAIALMASILLALALVNRLSQNKSEREVKVA